MSMTTLLRCVYIVELSFVLMHEMDAVHWKEWRIFGFKDDEAGLKIFVAAHLPLYLLLLVSLLEIGSLFGTIVSISVSAFLIVHFYLHLKALSVGLFKTVFSFGIVSCIGLLAIGQLILAVLCF